MRKIYYYFIALFIGIYFLETNFPLSPDHIETPQDVNQPMQQAGFLLSGVQQSNGYETSYTAIDTLNWKLLGQITYQKKPNKLYGEVEFPIFNSKLKGINKKKIVMTGFVIPIDNTNYALSKNVFASCFFCGKAGPETIMGIKFRNQKTKLKTDQYVTLEGTLRLNDADVEDWIYHIEDAVIVKGN